MKPAMERPIFIVGSGRSGTSLLRGLLSAHPHIAIPPETHYMKYVATESGWEEGRPADFSEFWDRFTRWRRFRDLGVDPDRCLQLQTGAEGRSFRGIFQSVLLAYGERMGKRRVGEKTPGHWAYLNDLLAWFPDARILFMQRDPRAVAASRLKVPWVTVSPAGWRRGLLSDTRMYHILFKADRWKSTYERVLPDWRDHPNVLLVRYEELVDDTEGEVRRVCRFLEEPYDEVMIHGRTRQTVPGPAHRTEASDHFERTRGPVTSTSLDKWKRQLKRGEVALIESVCHRGMLEAGYTPSLPAPPRAVAGIRRAFSATLLRLATAEAAMRSRIGRR